MAQTDDARRRDLGAFLRARRDRLTTDAVGLPATARRRTGGLRREEVAQLAGISTTWYVRIEQGREVSASAGALDRVARALLLDSAERAHLFTLAERRDPMAGATRIDEHRLDTLRQLIDALSAPAYVLDRRWNARGWNAAAAALFERWLSQPDSNLLRYVFLDPAAPAFIVDWADRGRRLVAECRAEQARRQDDPCLSALIAELRERSRDFAGWWEERHVLDPEGGLRRFRHPRHGAVCYEQFSLVPVSAAEFRIVTLLPREADAPRGDPPATSA